MSTGAMLASPTSPGLKSAMVQAMRQRDIFTGIHSTFSQGSYYSINGKFNIFSTFDFYCLTTQND